MNKNRIMVIMTSFLLAVAVFFQSSMDVKAAFDLNSVMTTSLMVTESEQTIRTFKYFNYDGEMLEDAKYRVRLVFDFTCVPYFEQEIVSSDSYWSAFYVEYGGVIYYPYVTKRHGGHSSLDEYGTVAFDFVCRGIGASEFSLYIDTNYKCDIDEYVAEDYQDFVVNAYTYSFPSVSEFSVTRITSSDDEIVSAIQQGSSSISSSVQQGTSDITSAVQQGSDDIVSAVQQGSDDITSAVANGNSILSKINNYLNRMSNGYDSSTGDGAADSLDGSLGSYDDAESAVTDTAIGNLDNYTISSDGIAGYAVALTATFPLVGAMLQSIFDSAGNFAIIITAGFTLTITCMIIGISKFFVR